LARAGRPAEIVALLDSDTEPPAELTSSKRGVITALLDLAGRFVTARIQGAHIFPAGNKIVHFASWLWGVRRGPELLMLMARFSNALFRGRASIRGDHFIQMRIFSKMWNDWRTQSQSSISLETKLVLFRSEDPGLPDLGWSTFSSNLTVIPAAGDHYTMLESEHLDELITRFIAAMNRAASAFPNVARWAQSVGS